MAAATTMHRGGRIIQTWDEPCPHCEHDIAVSEVGLKVRCAKCDATFQTAGGAPQPASGAQVSLDSPTRIQKPAAELPSDPKDSLIGTALGRWTLLRLIGRGGMGRVYEAREGADGRRVALKVLNEELASDAHFVRRFQREAKLLGSLSHPHIVNVTDQGEDRDQLWFAMDYVRGESLRRVMERGTVDAERATTIAGQMAEALSYAHGRGIIHRDLKPENVLLDENGSVHLVDFGLSRLVDNAHGEASTRLTRTDVILGTYEYMAPEQRRGDRSLDGRADIFALGVILYEMLTGTLPLGRFTPPSQSAGNISPAFDEVINRSLATNRSDRYKNAGAFRDAILRAPSSGVRTPPPLPKSRPLSTPPPAPVVPHHRIDDARSVIRHIEILGALDRVCGIILILGGLALVPLSTLVVKVPWLPSIGGIVIILFGLYLLGLGKRLARLEKGSRESQITVSVLMLFLPPFVMALGIYGLIVMTSERARLAFRYGLKALRGADPVFEVQTQATLVQHNPPLRPKSASLLMRAFTLLAIFFSIYVGFIAIDVYSDARIYSAALDEYSAIAAASSAALVFSVLVTIRMFLLRRQRRGFGLALAVSIFLLAATSVLHLALTDARRRDQAPERSAAMRLLPDAPFRHHLRPFLHWEIQK